MIVILFGIIALIVTSLLVFLHAGTSFVFASMLVISFFSAYLYSNPSGGVGGIVSALLALGAWVLFGWLGALGVIIFAFKSEDMKIGAGVALGLIIFFSILPVHIFLIACIPLTLFLGYQYGKKQIFQ